MIIDYTKMISRGATVFLLFSLCVLSTSAYPSTILQNFEYDFRFQKWAQEFERKYDSFNTWLKHRNTFHRNMEFIDFHNQNTSNKFQLGLNAFADMTFGEWRSTYLGYDRSLHSHRSPKRNVVSLKQTVAPQSVDWREKGAVTPVKNQGQCGSCWSFSATGSMEGAHFLKTGKLVSLSEQQLVDCSINEGNHGCNGGLMDYAFEYVEDNNGIDSEKDYPYTAMDGACNTAKESKHSATFSSFVDVPHNNEDALKSAVAQQPVSVAIEADQPSFQFYKSGIFDTACGTQLDHGVLAVGYGSENGMDYWLVKNSWGKVWGDNGYIKLARNIAAPEGQCGIAMQASYPVA